MTDYMQKFRLDEQMAFVVGGVGLIGKQISTALASAGAHVVILDLDCKKGASLASSLHEAGFTVSFREFDCSDLENLEERFSGLVADFGCPKVYVNTSYPRTDDWSKSSFADCSLDSFRRNVDIHMNSYAWLARLVAEAMVADGVSGSIIQLGSTYGILGQDLSVYEGTDMHENMTYAAIKGGVTNLTRQMASYYGRYNIRVNTLAPGGLTGHVAGKSDAQNPKFLEQYSGKAPLRRLGCADEVASCALFLSTEASSYITGSALVVDGGWSVV